MNKRILTGVMLTLIAFSSQAQSLNSDYFLSGSFTRHELNPALAPERAYFSLPVFGGLSMGVHSNVGESNFIYNSTSYPGKLTTFMSKDVSRSQFLNDLPSVSKINTDLTMDIFSVGFKVAGGYGYLGLKIRNTESVKMPKEFFDFMKSGLSAGEYSISDMMIKSLGYADFELGHSRRIGDRLRIGAKLHLLAGLEYADVSVRQMNARMDGDEWRVSMDAVAKLGVSGVETGKKEDGTVDLDNLKYNFKGLSGFGMALDLGATYDMSDFVEGLHLSLSVTDLGFIRWKGGKEFRNDASEEVVFDGFHNVSDGDDISDQADIIGEDLKEMTKFYEQEGGSFTGGPYATIRFGVQYQLPWVKWLNVGELLTVGTSACSSFEARTSINLEPASWFDVSLNLAFSTYGTTAGGELNFHPNGFNFFVGTDGFRSKLSKDMIPMGRTSADFLFGIRFPIGAIID